MIPSRANSSDDCGERIPPGGSPRIVGELHNIGIEVAKPTVEKYKPPRSGLPSPTWRTFLDLHLKELAAIDFFVVPAASFRVLFVFFVLAHDRRGVLHFNVTEHPTAQWTAGQIVAAFPFDIAPSCLLRDGHRLYGDGVRRRIHSVGIDEVVAARLTMAAPPRGATHRQAPAGTYPPRYYNRCASPWAPAFIVLCLLSSLADPAILA